MKKILLLIFLLPTLLFSQDSDLGNWYLYFGNKKINNKWNWHHEVQYRNYNAIGDLEQLLLRTGIGYNLSENNNNLLLGYGYILSENYLLDDKIKINEHRVYQQFITKQKFNKFSLQHRYRFEQRFIEEDFKLRLRYFLGMNFKLKEFDDSGRSIYLSAYNELFLGLKDSIFDRNRLYGGLGYRINGAVRFEIGYMNQFFGNGNGRDQLNLVGFYSF